MAFRRPCARSTHARLNSSFGRFAPVGERRAPSASASGPGRPGIPGTGDGAGQSLRVNDDPGISYGIVRGRGYEGRDPVVMAGAR